MRLLYVDDDRINLLLFEHACAVAGGVHLDCAASGAEALECAARQRPDLLVLDLNLPDTDGHALLAHLRARLGPPCPPAWLCTADTADELQAAARQSGFDGIVNKPVTANDIVQLRSARRLA